MDYDDIVDQFIVNDNDGNEEMSENGTGSTGNTSNSRNSIPSGSSTLGNASTNSNSHTNDLMRIHLKSLIQSRQIARQTIQLKGIKERNQKYMDYYTGLSENIGRRIAGISVNSEKRTRILKSVDIKEDIKEDMDNEDNQRPSNELIPCRLELDWDGYKLSDVLLLPSQPAPTAGVLDSISSQLCQDYDLPADPFQGAISRCLKDQVEEWHVFQGALEGMKVPFEEIGPVPIRLDIIVGLHRLEDQLELSLDPREGNTENMKKLVDGMESPDPRILKENDYLAFKPLILHNLLEQLMLWRKGIVFGGFHRDTRSNNLKFHDGDVAVLLNDPPTKSSAISIRRHFADTNTYTPILSTLTVEELDKIEGGRERESRRRRRTTTTTTTTGPGVTAGSVNVNVNGKRSGNATTTTTTTSIVNNLTGTVRSPPRTLPTPTSYRGSLHRIQNVNVNSDDESVGGPRKRGRKKGSAY